MVSQDILRFLPFLDLSSANRETVQKDVMAALSVLFLSVPQGVAYALIAGLPPAMGLYAGALPAIFGSLFRSSRHVVTGPTNALSLLVGTAAAASVGDPMASAATLALMVGIFQFVGGVLKLGALVDYISSAVVLGYVTGAGVLVGAGQLGNMTSTPMGEGYLFPRLYGWVLGLGNTDPRTVGIALITAVGIVGLRRFKPSVPAPIVMIGLGIFAAWALNFPAAGITLVDDLAPVPAGFPPFIAPDFSRAGALLSLAIAAMVLSLVESSAVGRTIAGRTGQKLDSSVEFSGQGIANIASGLFGGYPVSGSLSRSILNEKVGAVTRLSGTLTGVFMIAVLMVLGPIINLTPLASLAGLILVIAIDLMDVEQIRTVLRSHMGDRLAFLGTVIGTWTLALDQAIYLGVLISMVQFLQKARLITVRDMVVNEDGRMQEVVPRLVDPNRTTRCPVIRAIHVEGSLFFGAANGLANALDAVTREAELKVLIVRLKRAHGLDYTSARVLEQLYQRVISNGRIILFTDIPPEMVEVFDNLRLDEVFDSSHLFPIQPEPLGAMNQAMAHGLEIVGEHSCGADCPMAKVLARRQSA
jgi:SulP family sulfate permease